MKIWNGMITLNTKLNTSYYIHILHVYGQLHIEFNESICLKNYALCMFSCSCEIWLDPVGWWPWKYKNLLITKESYKNSRLSGSTCYLQEFFKDQNILPMHCLYISDVVCCVKSDLVNMNMPKIRSSYSVLQNYSF
jgi:hypothetical protein